VHLIDPGQLNTYDVLVSDDVVFTEAALASFVAGGPKGKSVKARASSAELDDAAGTDATEDEPVSNTTPKKAAASKAKPVVKAEKAAPVATESVPDEPALDEQLDEPIDAPAASPESDEPESADEIAVVDQETTDSTEVDQSDVDLLALDRIEDDKA